MLNSALCSLNLLILIVGVNSDERGLRSRRYLVYPDGGPARAQFIIGLGVPVDLKDQSVTVGAVIKFQYDLPTNSSEYTSRIYGFANTIDSRDMQSDTKEDKTDENGEGKEEMSTTEVPEDDEDTLVDINFDQEQKVDKRSIYLEGGTENNIDSDTSKLSLAEAIKRQEEIEVKYREQDPEMRRTNRWDLYKIMERMAERYGYTGRSCMLRTVCDAAEIPFTHHSGLLGEITHILFTPSTTKDELSHHTDSEYHEAERRGRESGVDCESLFPECEASILETFTQVGLNTLRSFGFD